jgi:hypothetical protein
MAKLFGELLFGIIRGLAEDLFKQILVKVDAWLNSKVRGRILRIVLGGLLGIAAYFLFPIMMGLLGL